VMLVSSELLRDLQKCIQGPAQLCFLRMSVEDKYLFRVRYKDIHLDYVVTEPLDLDELRRVVVSMGAMVVPPDAHDRNWNPRPGPAYLNVDSLGKLRYEW